MKKLLILMLLTSCGIKEQRILRNISTKIESCILEPTEEDTLITCPDGSTATILNGLNGVDGLNGTNGQDGTDGIVEIIDPCGDDPGNIDEVLIRTSSGPILAWYLDLGLAVIEPDTYQTTDDQSCVFTINADGSITDTLTVQATRERPSGLFLDQEIRDLISFTVPSTMNIINISGPLSHSGQQWAHIETKTTKYCYQMTGVTSKILTYRLSIPETDNCAASSGLPNDGLAGTEISTTSLIIRMNNSVKQSGNHVTTTVQTNLEVTR